MVRKKAHKPEPDEAEFRPYWPMTPNQIVAWNLAQARAWRGWTQDQAAEAMAPYLGVRWSKTSFSQAERSIAGKVVRNFTADEIVAFARAFEVPVTWFFMPPPAWADPGIPTTLDVPDATSVGESIAILVDLVFGDERQQAELAMRLQGFLQDLGQRPLTASQNQIRNVARHRITALARDAFRETEELQIRLRALANQLEDRAAQAKLAVADDLDIGIDDIGGAPAATGNVEEEGNEA